MPRRSIDGLRTIVTGATSGIGRALTKELVRQGACVLAVGRRSDRLHSLAAEIDNRRQLQTATVDVCKPADRQRALSLSQEVFGGLDALINNAGIGGIGRFDQASEARLRLIFEVNFFAPAEFIRQSLPLLQQGRRPLVVNVGSVLGHRAVPGKSEYCASKFALHGLTDALRIELKTCGVDVLLVSPSTTQTEFFDRAGVEQNNATAPFLYGAMSAETVARRIARAMALGRRETILSAGGKILVWLDRLCPPLAEWVISRWG